MANPGKPALTQLIEQEFEGKYQANKSIITLSTSSSQIVPNNFERLGLTIVNTGAQDAFISLEPNATVESGIVLLAAGGHLSLIAREDLVLVGDYWTGITDTGTTTLYVIEIVRYGLLSLGGK